MKNVILWGSGKYFEYKVPYLSKEKYNIIGVVSKDNEDCAYPLVAKDEILNIEYDEIIIMSERYMFEILEELLELHVDSNKIVLGANITPATNSEAQYIFEGKSLKIEKDGSIVWNNSQIISNMSEIEELKKINRGYMSADAIRLMPLKPLSYDYGASRGGKSIARYYIDKFVKDNEKYIHGTVIEVGDARYTALGTNRVTKSQILILDDAEGEQFLKGNLETGAGLKEGFVDCFILTNVFSCLFDVQNAVVYAGKSIKQGGHAIITVPGIAGISRMDSETYGQYWRFTPMGIKQTIEKYVPNSKISIKTFGNVKASAAFLYGMNVEDLTQEELDYTDNNYPLVIGVLLEKC